MRRLNLFYLLLVLVLSSVMPVNAQNKYQMTQDEYGTYYVEIDGLKYYTKGPNHSLAYLRDDLNPGITGSIKIVDNFIGIYGLKEKLHNVNSVDLHGTGISSVTLPNKQYTSLKFNDCMNLRSVTFVSSAYESMTGMGNCFYGCTSLTNVYFLPSSLTGLGDSTFEGCTGLETVSLPEGVTRIGKNCFAGCTNLHTIALGNNIASIGENAFENCISLQSVIIPKGLEVLSTNTFNGCTNLYNLYFEEDSKLNLISYGAFGGCDNLKKIVLPDREPGVKLDGNVFDSGLEEIVISKNSIVVSGFQKCSNLKDVYVLWDKKEYRMNIPDNYFWLDGNSETTLFGTTTLHVPTGTTAFYKELTKYAWSKFEHIVEFDTTDVHYIVDVNLNTGGTVFFNSQNRYVRKGKATFEKDGKAYTDFWFKIVPDKGYKIKSVTNNYVNEKTNTEVISRISADGYYEVKYTGWRQKLNVVFTRDYSYKPKGNSISFNSQSVQNVCIDNWDSDDDGVFSPDEAASVTSLDGKFQAVSASRTRAEQDLITSFDELIYFTGLTSLADDEFNGQTEMTSVTIPVNVKSIGKSAFHDCSSLISMIIPANVTSIGENAFIGCTGLTEITVESDTPVDISGNARFDEAIYANAVLYVPVGSKEKYLAAEGWKNFASILEDGINESVQGGQISFADPVVETICLKSWDANKDEKLSEAEAAAVTSLGEVFRNSEITTFDELQYFTGLTKLDDNAFTYCKSLTAITIPANVTTIGESVFAGCEKLTGLKVAEGNASFSMDDGVLYNKNYTSLIFCPVAKTGTVTVNSTTTTIRENAFYNCTQLTGISLPSSLTTISSAAFVGCSSLTTIAIPANVSSIGMGCFTGCTALKSITVDTGNSAYSASDGVLVENQTKLMAYPNAKGDTYAVGEGVTTIDGYAFCMTGIKSLTLPSTLKAIGDYAISYCDHLETIVSHASVPPTVSATTFSEGTFSSAALNVPYSCKNVYSAADVWKSFNSIVEMEAPLDLNDGDVFTAKTIEGVEMTFQVISKADKTCQVGVSGKEEICFDSNYNGQLTIPAKANGYDVISIAPFACSGSRVTSIIVSEGIKTIEDRAFGFNGSMESITLPEGLETIGSNIVWSCGSLKSFHVPSTVTEMHTTFGWCDALEEITVAEGNEVFDSRNNCNAIIKTKTNELLAGCKNTVIPNTVEILAASSFTFLKSLTEITIPEGVKVMRNQIFAKTSLKSITIPSTMTTIGSFSFDGCEDLTEVTIKCAKPFVIKDDVFTDVAYGGVLNVPFGTKSLYEGTDGWKNFRNIVEMENQVVEQGYAVFDSETGTLTFKYGEKPAGDNVYDTDNTDYTWESQAWDCSQIKKVVFDPSFAAARPKSTTHWFYKSESLTEIVGIEYLNTSEVTTMRGMFSGCGNLTNLDVHKFVTDNVTNMAWMFENCSSLKSLDVSKFNTSNVTDLGAMFDNCPSLTNLDVSHFDTGNAKSLNSMFRGCSGLTSLDVSNFNTGNATDVCGMFENCSSLKSLDVSKFNTSNVIDLGAMFANCPSLTSLDVRHFDTSNAKSLNSMFRDCSGLTLIDLSSFDTNNAINMGAMFKNCNSLTTIHVGEKWNTTNVEDSDEMFAGCEKLVGGKGTAYDADHVDATYARIDGGVDNPGYYTGTVSESITISKALQVTYMSDKNLDFTGYPDLKAYVATGYDKSSGTIWLTRVKEVPANTGILLMGEAGDYEIPVKKGESTSYYMNLFKGTIEGTTIQTTDGDNTNYYLSNGDAGVGFYKVQGSVELKPNRAYLSVPTEIPAIGTAGSTETIKVSAAGQVPYYNSQSLDFSSLDAQGVKAYTATGYDYSSGTIWLTRVKQVPAETGILIMAPQGEYPVPTASVASVYANMFKGTLTGTTIQTHETIAGEDYINYYLSSGDAGVGFYKVTKDGGVTIGANRCYLPILNKDAAAGTRSANSDLNQIAFEEADEVIGIQLLRGIGDDEDGTTNLTPALSKGEGEWYTLQGQRVAKPGKGLYIRNGKVVVIK